MKSEIINYLNETIEGKKAGRKLLKINDIFISSTDQDKHFRVTKYGRDVLEKCFSMYKIKLNSSIGKISGNHILTLDTYMRSPYYISDRTNQLYVFEEIVATEFLIIDGDFDLWTQGKIFNNDYRK